MSQIDHEYTDEIVCPYCGLEHGDSWEVSPDNNDIGLIECEDDECGKSFYATRNIEVTYSTQKATYGTCKHCGDKDVPVENYNSSLGQYEGLCVDCGQKELRRLEQEYDKEMRAEA